MKKLLRTSALLFATAFLFSCSDDDGGGVAANIEGKWTPTKTVTKIGNNNPVTVPYTGNEEGCDKDYVEFQSGGNLRNVVFFRNASDVCTEDAATATWSKSDAQLDITGGTYEGEYEIKKLSGSELQIEGETTVGGSTTTVNVYFKKVN